MGIGLVALAEFLKQTIRDYLIVPTAAICFLACTVSERAAAQQPNFTDILGSVIGDALNQSNAAGAQSNVGNVQNSWLAIDPLVRFCLAGGSTVTPLELARAGIRADDPRVQPVIQTCQRAVAGLSPQQFVLFRQRAQGYLAAEAVQLQQDRQQAAQQQAGVGLLGPHRSVAGDKGNKESHSDSAK